MANIRTAKKAGKSFEMAFSAAFSGASGVCFLILSLLLLGMTSISALYEIVGGPPLLKKSLSGYALGVCTVALLGRVGGGIYAKAADVGADLAGKSYKLDEDDPRNPGVVADNVGDNIGDIVGAGSDLISSLAGAVCATTVTMMKLDGGVSLYFPLLVFAAAVLVSLLAIKISFVLTNVDSKDNVLRVLKGQCFMGTLLGVPVIFALCGFFLPGNEVADQGVKPSISANSASVSLLTGLFAGYILNIASEYFTSKEYYPVQEIAKSCHTGSVIDIIYGLALGQMSTVLSALILASAVYVSYTWAGKLGLALAAVGMLSIAPIICIGGFVSPIADNAASLSHFSQDQAAKHHVEQLHAAAKVVKSRERAYSVGCAAMTGLAVACAFTSECGIEFIDLLHPVQLAGLVVGAMVPYGFSAQVLRSVAQAALMVAEEIRKQLPDIMAGTKAPEYEACAEMCTTISLSAMIVPAVIALMLPVACGVVLGPLGMSGLLFGIIISGVQLGTSLVNSGVAWDNAMKIIEGTPHITGSTR